MMKRVMSMAVLATFVAVPVCAQRVDVSGLAGWTMPDGVGGIDASGARQPPAAPVDPEAGAEEEEGERRNEVALVLAGTHERGEEETSFTVGAEYARRFGSRFAIVGEFEYITAPDIWVFAAPLAFQPVGGLKLFAGPGFERRPVEDTTEAGESEAVSESAARENLFLWRVGTSYGWEFSRRYVLSPAVYVDFVRQSDGEWARAFVFGITAGVAF